jgi:arabinan endo-1,5-alpha-L-arabinosidase
MVLDVGARHSSYYAFSTGDRFPVMRSSDLVRWTPAGTAMASRPKWTNQVNANWNPWAPSVMQAGGRFVMFYVAINTALTPDVNCIGVATSSAPGGPYSDRGMLTGPAGPDRSGRPIGCGDDAGYSNIDPQPFVDATGSAYLLLSTGHRCAAPAPQGTCGWDRQLSLIPLAADLLRATGPRKVILPGGQSWEAAFGDHVVEAPWLRRRGTTYELFYSGGSYQGAYGVGYATASSVAGPYQKSPFNPILRGTAQVVGPGGGSLVIGPRGGQWLAYHGRAEAFPAPRLLRMDSIGDSGGRVVIDGPTSSPRNVP